MSVFFSCIGTTDPVRNLRDGSMLHILRHYRPEIIELFFSPEMEELSRTDQRFERCFDYFRDHWDYRPEVLHYSSDRDPADFDAVGEEILSRLDALSAKHPGQELLLNLSSGTPQMKMILAQAAVSTRYRARGIQVLIPGKAAGTSTRTNDKDYDIALELELNEDEQPGSENRCLEPKLLVTQRQQQKERIGALLDRRDYAALQNLRDILPGHLSSLVQHLDERNHLRGADAQNTARQAKRDNPELPGLYPAFGRAPQLMDAVKMTDYYLMLRNLQRVGDSTGFVLRLNPFVISLQECLIDRMMPQGCSFRDVLSGRSIFRNCLDPMAFQQRMPALFAQVSACAQNRGISQLENRPVSMVICNAFLDALNAPQDMLDFFDRLEQLNAQQRNDSAHRLSETLEADIKRSSGMESAQIVNRLSDLLTQVYPEWNQTWAKIYETCNVYILSKL